MRVLSVHKKTWNAKLRSEFKFEFESNNMKQNRKQKEWKKWKQHLGHLYTLSVQTPNHTHPMCPISCLHSCRPSWVPGAARELTGRWRRGPLAGFCLLRLWQVGPTRRPHYRLTLPSSSSPRICFNRCRIRRRLHEIRCPHNNLRLSRPRWDSP